MQKTEVYSWRVSPATKGRLEEAARSRRQSVAQLLDEIVTGALNADDQDDEADADQQRRLHARAARFAGCLTGRDPRRAERAAELVRARLRRRRDRAR